MNFVEKLIKFYINSSIHVALSVYALVQITNLYIGLSNSKQSLGYFIFFATIVGYNFVKYITITKLQYKTITNNLKLIEVFTVVCLVLMIFYGVKLCLKTLLLLIPFMLLTLFYAIPFFKKTKNLRNIASLKIIIIAIVWTGITVLLPILNANIPINFKSGLIVIQRFLFVFVLTLPFDIRDFRFDKKQLQTIPQLIGVERTKKFGFILLVCTLVIEFFITPNITFKYIFIVVFMLLLGFLQRANIKQNYYYSAFWVEGIPIFWWFLCLILL